jgi:hypothetical protein
MRTSVTPDRSAIHIAGRPPIVEIVCQPPVNRAGKWSITRCEGGRRVTTRETRWVVLVPVRPEVAAAGAEDDLCDRPLEWLADEAAELPQAASVAIAKMASRHEMRRRDGAVTISTAGGCQSPGTDRQYANG